MHDVFPLKTLKSISSCLSSCSGQRAKPKGVNPFIFASRFKQPPYQWTYGKAFEAERAMKGLSISITLLTCIRVVSPVQNGEMIFMLMGAGRSEGAISDVAHTALIINPLQLLSAAQHCPGCVLTWDAGECVPKECVPAGSLNMEREKIQGQA